VTLKQEGENEAEDQEAAGGKADGQGEEKNRVN